MIKNAKNLILGLAVALGFLLAVEGILWISGVETLYERTDPYVGFSGYSPLFVEKKTMDGEKVFATADTKINWFNYQQFPVSKANGVTRMFCLGGSTTYGRPYNDKTSFCGWLREFLPAVDPSRQWEVINAGGISYASYRVARLMEALEQYEPDLFVIYTGHNEFLEERTYEQFLNTPEFLRDLASLASRLRIYSLLSDLINKKKDVLETEVNAILDNSVGPEDYHRDDDLRDAVLEHYRISLQRMSSIGREEGAGIIFVTPASNIRDFSPFKAEPSAGLDSASIYKIGLLKQSVNAHLDNDDPEQALDLADRALAIDPRDAELLFLKGKALLDLNRINEARGAFISARDEDIAPLRALTLMPGIVKDVARENANVLVDFAGMIEAKAPDGIPGDELFLDHVHPTIEANRMLALAIVDEMIQTEIVTPAASWNEAIISKITESVKSNVDEEANAMALTNLSRVLNWAGKEEEALRLVERATSITTDQHTVSQMVAVLMGSGQYEEALPYARQAAHLMPEIASVRKTHGIILAQLDRNGKALKELKAAARLDPTMTGLYYHLGLVQSKLGFTDQGEKSYRKALELEPDNADACNNLGILLARRGDLESAKGFFERAVKADPNHQNALDNLDRAKSMLGE